jgi:hypothetical protein
MSQTSALSTRDARARVIQIFPQDAFGVLLTEDQKELRFHPHDVRGGQFAQLRVGSRVRLQLSRARSGEWTARDIRALGPHPV